MLAVLGVLLLGAGATPAPSPCATLEGCLAMVNTSTPERCVQALTYASAKWPDSLDARRGLALCLGVLGRNTEALVAAKRCLELSPADAACLSMMGTNLCELGRRTEARGYLERVVSAQVAEGKFPHALKTLAEMDIEEEAAEAARRHLDLAWGLVSQNATRASLHRVESKLALLKGDGASALEHLRAAETLRGAAEHRVLQAAVLAWQGSMAPAAELLRSVKGTTIQATWRTVADRLEAVLSRKADVQVLRRWVDANPTDEHAWLILALERHLSGDSQAASAVLDEGRQKAGSYLLRPRWGSSTRGKQEPMEERQR